MKVYAFTFNQYQENTYIIADESTNECAIIDPGCSSLSEQNKLKNFITEHNLIPVIQINTHAHLDHVIGCKFIYDTYNLSSHFNIEEKLLLEWNPKIAFQMGFEPTPIPECVFDLNHNTEIKIGNSKVKCLFSPGHSTGGVIFYCEESKFAIVGDTIFWQSVGRTDLPGGNIEVLRKSIQETVFSLPDDVILYTGHGRSTTVGFEKQHNPFV